MSTDETYEKLIQDFTDGLIAINPNNRGFVGIAPIETDGTDTDDIVSTFRLLNTNDEIATSMTLTMMFEMLSKMAETNEFVLSHFQRSSLVKYLLKVNVEQDREVMVKNLKTEVADTFRYVGAPYFLIHAIPFDHLYGTTQTGSNGDGEPVSNKDYTVSTAHNLLATSDDVAVENLAQAMRLTIEALCQQDERFKKGWEK